MSRDAVIFCILIALATATMWCSSLLAGSRARESTDAEPVVWGRLWRPLIAPLYVLAAIFGWAVVDPDDCERVGISVGFLAAAGIVLLLRAAIRARRAAWSTDKVLAGTVGMLRPSIRVSPEVSSQLDEGAMRALLAHEEAHARHRDPVRQLCAQIATDLQWPFPGARNRLSAWRQALEIARDDEAVETGVDGADLAHAIVTCARLARGSGSGDGDPAIAQAMGSGEALSNRVRRLLTRPLPAPRLTQRPASLGLFAGLFASFVFGMIGDHVIERLLSLLP
jgi:Peptidase family M48